MLKKNIIKLTKFVHVLCLNNGRKLKLYPTKLCLEIFLLYNDSPLCSVG